MFRNNTPKQPNEVMKFPVASFYNRYNRKTGQTSVIDIESVKEGLNFLADNEVFKMLTVNVNIENSLLYGKTDYPSHSLTVGFINDIYNIDKLESGECEASVTIFSKSVSGIDHLLGDAERNGSSIILLPKVISENNKFKVFNGFSIIQVRNNNDE